MLSYSFETAHHLPKQHYFSDRRRKGSRLEKLHENNGKERGRHDWSLLPFSISVTFYNNYSYIAKEKKSVNTKHCVNRNAMIILYSIIAVFFRRSLFGEIERLLIKNVQRLNQVADDDTAAACPTSVSSHLER